MPRRRNQEAELINSAARVFTQLDARTRTAILVLLLIAGFVAAAFYFQSHRTSRPSPNQSADNSTSPQLLLGNPSSATADPKARANYLMVKPYYALSYNDTIGTPNWVSWRVTSQDFGDSARKPSFDADTTLPTGFYRVTHKDYSNSGFDRGHLCPHGDRAATREMSFATFVMSNIIPQATNLNTKAWNQLEIYCRNLVRAHQHLYIISGPAGRGGKGISGFKNSIANGKVTVPSHCWKIVLAVPENGDDDLAKIGPGTRVISVLMPNDNDAVNDEWGKFRTSAAEIESRTGLKFFDRVGDGIAQVLRQKVDNTPIPAPRPVTHTGG